LSGYDALACVGAAGSLAEAVALGDVVVATVTVEHDFKERFDPTPLPRHAGDPVALSELMQVVAASTFPFRVQFGPVASGDEDIIDESRARQVQGAIDAVCVAWEGSGGARAAAFSGIGYLEVRAVTDAADVHAARSFRDTLRLAMSNAAHLLLAWHAAKRLADPALHPTPPASLARRSRRE
jgi:adenosylhomocysteine nucleosidase